MLSVSHNTINILHLFLLFSSFHLQFHGSHANLRFPGRPLQQEVNPELRDILLVSSHPLQLLHHQAGTYQGLLVNQLGPFALVKAVAACRLLSGPTSDVADTSTLRGLVVQLCIFGLMSCYLSGGPDVDSCLVI